MKKILFLLLASFLVLAACDQEESKLDDKKETKASDKESNKDDKKKDDDKESDDKEEKSDDKSNEEIATQDETTEQSQEQVNTQEQPIQSQEQAPVAEAQDGLTSGPTEENPANLNPNEEQNTNMNGEHVVSPGWTQDEQSAAYEEYKKGKQAQAAAGPSAVPGAGLMDLDE